MMFRVSRVRRTALAARRTLGNLMMAAGALVILTPLASSLYAEWSQGRLLRQFEADNPVMAVPARGPSPVPATAPDAAPPPAPEARAALDAPAIRVDRSQGIPAYRLEIPTLGMKLMVLEGVDEGPLARAPGHYPGTALPGEVGNAAIAGHRTQKGRPSFFYDLNKLKAGDAVLVAYADISLVFTVEKVFITHAYDWDVVAPTPHAGLTLTTCDPPGTDTNRLIVHARLTQVNAR